MGKLWLDNGIADRLAMLQQTEADHDGISQIAIEKDWWMTVTLKALFQTECRDALKERALYDSVVEHRRTYYALKYVNYDLLDPATIDFTLPERVLGAWKEDYANMRRFFIYGQSLEFDALIQRLKDLQDRVRNI